MLINKQLAIHIVKLPLPFSLDHINSYAIEGKDGWWLVDAGLNTEPCRQAWGRFMESNNLNGSDIKGIYLTHSHPDHFGAAGWLQQLSGSPVYISALDAKAINMVWQGSGREITKEVEEQLIRNGLPPELTNTLIKDIIPMLSLTQPHPVLSIIEPGCFIRLGDFQYLALSTPGHSDGHMCFFNQEYGLLLSGDHLLASISPNISLWPDGEPDPLNNYLESLQANRKLACKTVLPAHGSAFNNLEFRISELEAHHNQRLELIKGSVNLKGSNVYEISRRIFGQELKAFDLRLAMTETLAHLMYLVYRGELEIRQQNGINIFTNPGALRTQ